MSKGIEQKKDADITELAEEDVNFDELEMDNREWLRTPPVQLKEYRFDEADSEEEYYAMLEELSSYLIER